MGAEQVINHHTDNDLIVVISKIRGDNSILISGVKLYQKTCLMIVKTPANRAHIPVRMTNQLMNPPRR